MAGKEAKHDTSAIRQSSDKVNEACNLWIDARNEISEAWLAYDSLGKYGEPARLKYEETVKGEALSRMNKANIALINIREALTKISQMYDAVEEGTKESNKKLRPQHRPEIDDPRY